jgi:outer membrane murein-binding lipoprotein Lpp
LALVLCGGARGQTFNPQLDRIATELQHLRHELSSAQGPSAREIERAARREWVVPRFGLGGELLNASEIPPQFRLKVASSMGKSVEQVFARQLVAERNSRSASESRVRNLQARISQLEAELKKKSARQ